MRRFGFCCLVILLLVFGIAWQGEVRLIRDYGYGGVAPIGTPNSVLDDPEGGDTGYWVFNEEQGVMLSADLAVDGGTIPAGTVVDSLMIFLNTEETGPGASVLDEVLEFDGVVLGVMSDIDGSLEVTSSPLLGHPNTIYPEDSFSGRGLEHHGDGISEEGYTFSANMLTVGMDTTDDGDPGDWIRVITEHPLCPQINIVPPNLNLKSEANLNKEEEFKVLIDLPEGHDEEDIDISTIYFCTAYGAELLSFPPFDMKTWSIVLPALSSVVNDDGNLAFKADKLALIAMIELKALYGEELHHGEEVCFYVFGGGLTDGRMFRFVGSDTVKLITWKNLAPTKQRKVNSKSSTWGSIKAK